MVGAIRRVCVRLVAQPLLARTPSVDPVGLGGLGGLILILVGAGELALRIFGGAGEGEDRAGPERGRQGEGTPRLRLRRDGWPDSA
jgi:hypothetical protein